MAVWYNRPLVFVRNCRPALDFYVEKLGFAEAWRHEDAGRLLIAQVDRDGTELILTEQWAEKAGQSVMFISLNPPGLDDDAPADVRFERESAAIDKLKADFEARGAEVHEGWWGYRLLVVKDPDGNELWFNYPNEPA
jgi:uncharacterized glyoxalase superfamily protein PhnB